MKFPLLVLIPLLVLFLDGIAGETTHTVTVGLEGSFFNPPTVSARLGDTITFLFAGEAHTVTQSSFGNPCAPLPGGFNSGLAGRMRNAESPAIPTWDLHITNVSQPIWFFCQANRPAFHCSAGMVGVINPPSQEAYTSFLTAAKAVSASPSAAIVPALTGVGAFASEPPSVHNDSRSISSVIPATPPTATSGSASNHGSISVIVGGVVGGSLGVLLILVSAFLCIRHQRLAQKRYLATLAARIEKERELDARPFSVRSATRSPEPMSRGRASSHSQGLSTPLQPLRRRATIVGSIISNGTQTETVASLTGTRSPISSEHESRLISPSTTETVHPFNIRDSSNQSGPPVLPSRSSISKSAAALTHSSPSRAGRASDLSSLMYPVGGSQGRDLHDGYDRQRYVPMNPHALAVTPEQYWSAQMERSGNHIPSRDPLGYSTSPPNYLVATGGYWQTSERP